jgi:serine/threonine-protein kinase
MTLDDALACTQRLLTTLEKSHKLPIFHRDLKPDNIILREHDPLHPVLVDFGIAWAKVGDEPRLFETNLGVEMGNRFLRLPEYAPGRVSRDARSDITLVAGLLLFMLSGFSPRVLRDEYGRLPHEAGANQIPGSVREDLRWARLRRVFQRAFQTELELRYQSISDLCDALEGLEPTAEPGDVMGLALERFRNFADSERVQRFHRTQGLVQEECAAFANLVSRLGGQAGFGMPGSHGFTEDGRVYQVRFGIQRPGTSGGTVVWYRHEVHIGETEFLARYGVGQSPGWNEYYRGSIADPEGLCEAMTRQAPVLMAELLDEYTHRLKGLANTP